MTALMDGGAQAAVQPQSLRDRSYVGERGEAGPFVWITSPEGDSVLVAPSGQPLWAAPWGRRGFSSWELAWAMIFDAGGDSRLADDWAHCFGESVVARLPPDGFVLSADDVVAWLDWPAALLPSHRLYS